MSDSRGVGGWRSCVTSRHSALVPVVIHRGLFKGPSSERWHAECHMHPRSMNAL